MPDTPSNPPSSPRRLLVTGSDARYYPLLQEMIASVRRFPEWTGLEIACLDGGLNAAQKAELLAEGIIVKSPLYPLEIPQKAIRKRPDIIMNPAKLWLDRTFPEFDTYVWFDADLWLQESTALSLYFEAAESTPHPLVMVPEMFNHKPFRLRWWPFNLAQNRSILYKNARLARLPRDICRAIGVRPTLNGGAFALSRHAVHWEILRQWQKHILRNGGKIFSCDQLSFALVMYHDKLPQKWLPTGCNYMGPWLWNPESGKLCEDFYPHQPVNVVHLAGYDEMRLDPAMTIPVTTLGGKTRSMNLRFSQISEYAHQA